MRGMGIVGGPADNTAMAVLRATLSGVRREGLYWKGHALAAQMADLLRTSELTDVVSASSTRGGGEAKGAAPGEGGEGGEGGGGGAAEGETKRAGGETKVAGGDCSGAAAVEAPSTELRRCGKEIADLARDARLQSAGCGLVDLTSTVPVAQQWQARQAQVEQSRRAAAEARVGMARGMLQLQQGGFAPVSFSEVGGKVEGGGGAVAFPSSVTARALQAGKMGKEGQRRVGRVTLGGNPWMLCSGWAGPSRGSGAHPVRPGGEPSSPARADSAARRGVRWRRIVVACMDYG